jgi:para-aminobenzoate synthetase component 1
MTVLLQSNSARPHERERYDILTAAPEYTVTSHHQQITIEGEGTLADNARLLCNQGSLETVSALLSPLLQEPLNYSDCIAQAIPFCGGLLGYCSYDLAREYNPLPTLAKQDIDIPEMQFSFFGWACIQDHARQKSWLVIHPHCNRVLRDQLKNLLLTSTSIHDNQPCDTSVTASACNLLYETSREYYFQQLDKVHGYIQAGDCYQINLSQRVHMETETSSEAIYQTLRRVMPSPFCAFMTIHGTDSHIISLSPERFLHLDDEGTVITQPIKGTIRRGNTPLEDEQLALTLMQDGKNRAENIMIVDLLRNDLGKVCETGSIHVDALCELRSFSNVHHLVSTISGKLKPSLNGADLLQACFPGGSITGAPKIRAMQIIEETEHSRRSIYCGSIAYFSTHGVMDSSILIRTLLHQHRTQRPSLLYCWGGGGIVADSDNETEYQESFTKINSLLKALVQ